MFLNLRHNSLKKKGRLVRKVDQNGGKFERFKTSKKDRILSKSNFSFAEVHWVTYRIRQKIKILTIWALQIDGKHNLHTGCCKKCYTNNFALIESLWTLREGDNFP